MGKACVGERLLQAAREVFERHSVCDLCAPQAEALTRERILAAARTVFAEKGTAATVRDICYAANANVAAVNYHFGSKDDLLAALLANLLEEAHTLYPMDGGVPAGARCEDRLYGFVFGFLCRILMVTGRKEDGVLGNLLSDAFARPLPAFERYAEKHRAEVTEWLMPLLQELTAKWTIPPARAGKETLLLVLRSIMSQILVYKVHRNMLLGTRDREECSLEEIADIAKHITEFSLGGIKHISEQIVCG